MDSRIIKKYTFAVIVIIVVVRGIMKVLKNETDDILLSIVMPAYNSEKYISRCIESIYSQNDIVWELIIVNDGSSDATEDICLAYTKKNSSIRLITQENAGCTAARRKGILESKGKYILNVDSDDYLIPEAMKELKKHILSEEFDVVQFGHYEIFHRVKFKKRVLNYSVDREDVFGTKIIDLLGGWRRTITPNVWDKLYRGDILRDVMSNFCETISIGDDILINLKFFENNCFSKMRSIDSAFYVYRKDVGIMSSTNWKDLPDYNLLKLLQLRFIDTHNLSDNARFHCYWEVVGIVRYASITLLQSGKSDDEIKGIIESFFNLEFVKRAQNYLTNRDVLPVKEQEKVNINDFCTRDYGMYIQSIYRYIENVTIHTKLINYVKKIIKKII